MFIDFKKNNRSSLTVSQKKFLQNLVPLSQYVQHQSWGKANFKGIKCPAGILASVTIGQVIYLTNWGTHPVSQDELRVNGKKFKGNNLLLLETDPYWGGQVIPYEDKEYKSYKTWSEFAVNWTDYLVFSGLYIPILETPFSDEQISLLQQDENDSNTIESLLITYNLKEFDYGP